MSTPHWDNYIGGTWTGSDRRMQNWNPSDLSDLIGESAAGDTQQVGAAVAAAKGAVSTWNALSIQTRSEILDRIGSEILARREELGALLSREEGKIKIEGIGEVARAGNIFKFFAGEILRTPGQLLPSVRPAVTVEITREPVGVVALITPWNFPIAIPAWKIAPALAYGNAVVWKPAALVTASAWALTEIIHRAGLPPGVFNMVMGSGSEIGRALLDSPDVAAISFTGSQAVGNGLAAQAATRLARVQLEMGGKNAQIVLDDAELERAVEICAQSAFFSTGRRCTAASRLVVTEGIHDRFVEAMIERMRALRVGHALETGVDIGPLASEAQQAQTLSYLALGVAEGARLQFGGEELVRPTKGYYVSPALLTETTSAMRVNREEIFGPVASIIRVRDYEEALSVVNKSDFGLTAGIATSSLKHATHFKRNAQVGMVMVNLPTAGVDYHVPFGGRKASSYGPREQGTYAREFYTTVKTSYVSA